MYLLHYGLNEKPFTPCPDPRYLWFGDRQLELYAALEAAILKGMGIIILTGAAGTGKTTFIKSVQAGLRDKAVFANIRDPGLKELEFYSLIAHGLGMDRKFESTNEFIGFLKIVVQDSLKKRRRVVVAVDEAQRIEFSLLKKIWSFGKGAPELSTWMTWIFIGHEELLDYFKEESSKLLKKSIVNQFHMHPLGEAETVEYIRFRLKRAGSTRTIFSDQAIDRIYCHATGHPRLINSICDLALLYGYTEGTTTIRSHHIDACVGKVCLHRLPGHHQASKKMPHKATAWLLASMCCLTMYGLWTYHSFHSNEAIQPSRTADMGLQHLLPEYDELTPLSHVSLGSTPEPPHYKVDHSPVLPAKPGYRPTPRDDASLSKPAAGTQGIVSENPVPYGPANQQPKNIKKSPPKPKPAKRKSDAAPDGNFSADGPLSQSKKTAQDKDPDPSRIIDWLLEK